MDLQTSHETSEPLARRGKAATCAASPLGHLVLLLELAILSVVCISLVGCSGQRDASQMRNVQEWDALASDLPSPSEGMDYDPWESINDKTFYFNFNLADHYAIKPAAKVWSRLPEQFRQSLANAFYNLDMPKRFVNKVLQGRLPSAGLELTRFVLNTTVGVAGFFDVASRLGIEKSDADTGETFALYGVGPGPYLVLPLLPPLDVRDAFGFAADSFMDPLSWFVTPIGADVGRSAAKQINERANNMKLYDDVEDSSLDLYAAVRNGYLQRRRKFIGDAIRDRDRTWGRIYQPSEPEDQSPLGEDPKSTEQPENDDVENSIK
jgi:phospholipid-binding lipoprotein MlaA